MLIKRVKSLSECVPGDVVNETGDVLVIKGNGTEVLRVGRVSMTPEQAKLAINFGWKLEYVYGPGLLAMGRESHQVPQ